MIVYRYCYCSQAMSRKVFCHEYGKIPRHTGQNPITEGDLEWILTKLLFTAAVSVPQMKKNNRYYCNQDSVKTLGQISHSHRFFAKYDDKINSTSAHLQI